MSEINNLYVLNIFAESRRKTANSDFAKEAGEVGGRQGWSWQSGIAMGANKRQLRNSVFFS